MLAQICIDATQAQVPISGRAGPPGSGKFDYESSPPLSRTGWHGRDGLRILLVHRDQVDVGVLIAGDPRGDERAACDERRLGNRLRADLLAVFPAAVDIPAGDLGAAVFLRLLELERWPSAAELGAAGCGVGPHRRRRSLGARPTRACLA